MTPLDWILLAAGLGLLVVGAEALVRGAASLAARLRVPPLVVGLTIVAFGTSSPELAVSVRSALAGQADIAVGNVVGSNIFNVLFILGLSAVLVPLRVAAKLVRFDVPLMIVISGGLWLLALDGMLGRGEGALLAVVGVVYTVFLYVQGRRDGASGAEDGPAETAPRLGVLPSLLAVAAGLGLLALGARWLIDSSIALARTFGISETVIGLTIVAAGTSLPEVATSVMAGLRGERDIAVGNVVGSNVFNVLWVLGAACLIAPQGVAVAPSILRFDLPVMCAVALACLPICFTGFVIERWEGVLFLVYYGVYLTFLLLAAGRHESLEALAPAMQLVVLPLTAATLLALSLRYWIVSRRGSS